jgi:hypothetical protein
MLRRPIKEADPMLRPVSAFKGLSIAATDGDIGSVRDLYFDDLTWTVRYLVVDTGSWLPGRQVLISPLSVSGQRQGDRVAVNISKEQVENSPSIDADKPVDRQHEEALARHYDQRYYWEGPYRWGLLAYPGMPPMPGTAAPISPELVPADLAARELPAVEGDPTLRSAREVTGYYIAARDGDIGHVEDFLVDGRAWALRYIVVDTRNWWPGRKVVISPEWITRVSWPDSKVHVDLTQAAIKAAPEYDPTRPFERDYERRLFEHHGRRKYWEWEDR